MKNLTLIILIFLCLFPAKFSKAETLSNPEMAKIFIKANEAYQQQNFEDAKNKYETLVKNGLVNGHLFYNLGNCYTKLNNTGKAIVFYLKAKDLIPRDADLNSNLNFIKKRTADQIENSEDSQIFKRVFFWYDQLNTEEFIIIFLILWSLIFALLIAKRFIYSELIRLGIISFIFLNFFFGISFVAKLLESMQQKAVVTVQEANVKSSTDTNSVTIFKVHEGTVLNVTEKTDKWSKIELTKDKRGWIQDASIENL
jgi:tetratricopeptide (TPR) repeat protein